MKPRFTPRFVRLRSRVVVPLGAALCLHASPPLTLAAPTPDPFIPQRVAADRYQALAARSPFSPPTMEAPVQTAVAPAAPAWGERYTLSGISQIGAGFRVTLNPKNPVGAGASASSGGNSVNASERIIVLTGEPTLDGITLAGVQWNDDPKQMRATLIKNGVPAVFGFDATALSTIRGNAATAGSVPAPRSSASTPGIVPPGGTFPPPSPLPNGMPAPGIVRNPNGGRAPIRAPASSNGAPVLAPPPPPVPVRVSPSSAAMPGAVPNEDDD